MTEMEVQNQVAASPVRRGFYSPALDADDRLTYECALDIQNVDDEIAFLRMELIHLARHDPHNTNLNLRIVNTIDKLMRTRRLLQADKAAPASKVDRFAPLLASVLGDGLSPVSSAPSSPSDGASPDASDSEVPPAGESTGALRATSPSQLFSDLLSVSPHGGSPHGGPPSGRVPYFSHGVSPKTLRMRAKKKKNARCR